MANFFPKQQASRPGNTQTIAYDASVAAATAFGTETYYFGGNSTALGAVGGGESQTLTLAQLPTGIASSGSNTISVASTVSDVVQSPNGFAVSTAVNGSGLPTLANTGATIGQITSTGSNAIAVTSNNTSGNPHRTVPPTIICNYIVRII